MFDSLADQMPSLVSDGYEASPPPLVDSDGNYENRGAPLVLLDNEEYTNGNIVSKTPREVTMTTRHVVCAAVKRPAGVPPLSWQKCAPHDLKVPV